MLRASSTRLPIDHFLSGSLLGAMSSGMINLKEINSGNINNSTAIIRTLKFSIKSGITAAFAIDASNKIAQGQYLNSIASVALGIGAVMTIEKLIKE